MPNLLHHTSAYRGDLIRAGEAKAPLNLRVESLEVRSHSAFVNRFHAVLLSPCRRQRDADGSSAPEKYPTAESRIIPKLSVTGLKAATRYEGDCRLIAIRAPIIKTELRRKNGRHRQRQRVTAAKANSNTPIAASRVCGNPARESMAFSSMLGKSSFGTMPCHSHVKAIPSRASAWINA